MNKLRLKNSGLSAHEALSRDELKRVIGGIGPYWICVCPNGSYYQCLGGTEAACQSKSDSVCGTGNTATCSQEYSILG